jgi:hypothetical protein
MEITDEIKAKVFAQYLGQDAVIETGEKYTEAFEDGITHVDGHLIDWFHEAETVKIKLKPISAITDEDAIEVAKMFGVTKKIKRHKSNNCYFVVHGGYDSISFIENDVTYEDGVSVEGDVSRRLDVYQYLQSKGYDLPQYLLGNKTLHECGLAIYESDK